jgi:microcystin-dependent protein
MLPATVALSPESVTVLLFASGLLEQPQHWLDLEEDPLDEITVAEWDTIEKLIGNTYEEIMNPLIGYCFPLITALPDNCLLLDGASYLRVDYPALYEALDPAFIVDADNFTLPDLRSRVPIGAGTGTGLSTYTIGETGGLESVGLVEAENATHTHEDSGHQHTVGISPIAIPVVAPGEAPVLQGFLGGSLTGFGSANLQPSGSGTPHENRQPFTALPWAVVAL